MKLTKKHFEHTASVIKELQVEPGITPPAWELIVEAFARAYIKMNPSFNRLKFVNACNGKKWGYLVKKEDESVIGDRSSL